MNYGDHKLCCDVRASVQTFNASPFSREDANIMLPGIRNSSLLELVVYIGEGGESCHNFHRFNHFTPKIWFEVHDTLHVKNYKCLVSFKS